MKYITSTIKGGLFLQGEWDKDVELVVTADRLIKPAEGLRFLDILYPNHTADMIQITSDAMETDKRQQVLPLPLTPP